MSEKKLIISPKKFHGDSTVVTTRLPSSLVEQVDAIAKSTHRTRNEVVQLCLEFAVEHLEIEK